MKMKPMKRKSMPKGKLSPAVAAKIMAKVNQVVAK